MALLQSFHKAVKSLPLSSFVNRLISSRLSLKSTQKASLQSIPNEILFEIFASLELKPYILCHGVCKEWRQLLPLTQMNPIRKRLLDLYRRILNTPDFEETLEWTNKNLQPFDRDEYIRCLLAQYPAIPEEFHMWILEWPARLVTDCVWPGLTFGRSMGMYSCPRRIGINWIAYRSFSPQLSSLEIYRHARPTQTFIPGLYIWNDATLFQWLIFEKHQDQLDLFGRVLQFDSQDIMTGIIPSYLTNEDTDTDSVSTEDKALVFDDWICYLQRCWSCVCQDIPQPQAKKFYQEHWVHQPVPHCFGSSLPGVLPAPAWSPYRLPETSEVPN